MTTEDVAIACAVLFGILFALSLIALGIFIFLYCRIHKKISNFDENKR